ncbi:hypothetical protein [Nonlabens xylanidelens]|nr:hypothetical protein [Nonlabens xylanidelens]
MIKTETEYKMQATWISNVDVEITDFKRKRTTVPTDANGDWTQQFQ